MKSLIRFFYSQHIFANMLTVLVLAFGAVSLITIRKDMFPNVQFDITTVVAVFPGASPDQVEKLIINPLEQAIREVDGLKKVQSQALDSRAVITLTLDPDARDPKKTNDDIQRAVDQVEDYPEEAEKPVVVAIEAGQTPIIELSITSNVVDELTLRDTAKFVADQLASAPGVAKVNKDAWRKREIQIIADQNKLASNYLPVSQIIGSLGLQNLQLPAGDMVLPTGKEVSVKTDGELRTIKEIENAFVRSNFEGLGVRVKDVAEVREGLEKPTVMYRTNGQRTFKLTIIKKERADALKTVAAVQAKMESIKGLLPAGVEYSFVNDFTFYLKNRLSTLSGNMIVGIFLVCVVLALFLPFRVALVVAIGIPFSMFLAVMTVQYLGYSINLISLIGLIIVSGMLVDDTIVVTENIFRRLENGEDRDQAIIDGAAEMVAPVTASVLTTVAAFGPMLFMSGIFGKFIFEIPMMVILPLLFSLYEAFAVAPGHILTLVGDSVKAHVSKRNQKLDTKSAHWYDRFLPKYQALVRWTVQRRYKTFAGFFALLLLTGFLTTQMRVILFPPEGIYSFFVRVDGKPGATLQEMTQIMSQLEPQIQTLPDNELVDFTTTIGLQQEEPNDPLTKRASHYAQIMVNLTPETGRTRSVDEIVASLRETIKKPEGAEKISFSIAQGGPPQGRPIQINLYGDDFAILRKLADQTKEVLKTVEGVQDIEDSEVIGKTEIRVLPDHDRVSQVGLSVREVATTIRANFAGIVASSLRSLDEEIDIRVQLRPPEKEADRQLQDIKVGNPQGQLIPLSKIAKFEEGDSRLIIKHEKYKRVLTVTAGVDLEKTTAVAATAVVQEKLKDLLKDHPQYEISFEGENEDTAESFRSLARAAAIAAVLIFTILVVTFQSFVQPLLVLLALPLGFMGVIFALLIHGRPLSFMAMLGVIALAGVIVNNAIVYIDFFNSLRKEGKALQDALVEAATTRLRPILLTSLTTVLGLMPTAYGIGGSDGFVMALALALGWGLLIGSVLTVLFFPAILNITEDCKELGHRIWMRLTGRNSLST